MHVLTVLDHPDPKSFSAATAARFMDGAMQAGHSTELADLHAESFNPLWTMGDAAADGPNNVPDDVAREQARIERADAICLVFPLFWWGMPSMMKGWVGRVFSWGWAYDQLDDPEISLLRPRTGIMLVPSAARSDEMETKGYSRSIETLWTNGTFGYFGFSPRRMELLNGSKGSDWRRQGLLDRAFEAGRTLPVPASGAGR